MLDARDQGAKVVRIRGDATPSRSTIVRIECARVAVRQCAAWRTADGARPRAGDVVVHAHHNPARIAGIDSHNRLVLRGGPRVLVDDYVGRPPRGALEGA